MSTGIGRRNKTRGEEIARKAIVPLSHKGLKNTTLTEIGELLGMSAANVLYHFASKNDLFIASLKVVERDFRLDALEHLKELKTAKERWDWFLESSIPTGLDDSLLLIYLEAWQLAVNDPLIREVVGELEEDWQRMLRDILEFGIQQGEIPPGLDMRTVTESISGLQDGLSVKVLVSRWELSREEALSILFNLSNKLIPWSPSS